MSDPIDRAQEREQLDRELALEAQQRRPQGLDECEVCGAPISALRREIGARKCVPHQEQLEREQAKRGQRTCV